MDKDIDLWGLEERLWTGGAGAYRELLAPACIMAFPGPGLMEAEEIHASIEQAPRWNAASLSDRRQVLVGDRMVVLGYRVRARRGGDADHEAFCTSTWVRAGGGWRLIQHQQSPTGNDA